MVKDMDEIIKKGLEFGLGVTYITVEALNEAMTTLEKEGKISRKEGQKMVQQMARKYQAKGTKYARDVQTQMDRLIKASPFATKKDIAELTEKINEISKIITRKSKR